MKRIKQVMVAILLLLTVTGYSQFTEGFESVTSGPTGGVWTIDNRNWAVFDNGIGLQVTWDINPLNNSLIPGHTGVRAAYLQRETVSTGVPADWLVTPSINLALTPNPVIRFFSKTTIGQVQGSIYKVYISTTSQTGIPNFTLLKEWTDPVLHTDYEEIVIPIPAQYNNSNAYIAFVMEGNNKDRWLIDDIFVGTQCLSPTTSTASDITTTSAKISWDTPGTNTQWEIKIFEPEDTPPANGVIVNQNFYNATTKTDGTPLQPQKQYNYIIRSICGTGNYSPPFANSFLTNIAGATCIAPVVIPPTLPYIEPFAKFRGSGGYTATTSGCGTGNDNYLNGSTYTVYSYTAPATTNINIEVEGRGKKTAIFLYNNCNNIGVNCLASDVDDTRLDKWISDFSVTAGTTYYIVVAGKDGINDFSIVIKQTNCGVDPSLYGEFEVGNCTSGTAYDLTAELINLTNPVVATVYGIDGVLSTQTITTNGIVSLGTFTAPNVKVILQDTQYKNCLVSSVLLSKRFCLVTNDECVNAIPLTVGVNGACTPLKASTYGATLSSEPSNCDPSGRLPDDVWFEFVAISNEQIINIFDISGVLGNRNLGSNIKHEVYQGNVCNALTQLYCSEGNYSTAKGLIIGQKYKIKVFTAVRRSVKTSFSICVTSFPETCESPFTEADNVKLLLKNLLNRLLTTPSTTTPFTCPELTALAPFLTDPDPKIYNLTNIPGSLSFSFANHTTPDVWISSGIPDGGKIVDVNLLNYTSANTEANMHITFTDGTTTSMRIFVKHIDFCKEPCKSVFGKIKIASTSSCVMPGSANVFSLQTTSSNVASYAWSFYNAGMTLISTSTLAKPSVTFTATGNYLARLIITGSNGCTTKYEKSFVVSANCSSYCTETNQESETVKDIYINLINHLFEIYNAGGTVPSPYFCSELADLAPFITDVGAGIYNAKYTNGTLTFSFGNHGGNDVDVMVVNNGPITDIDLSQFIPGGDSDILTLYKCTYLNGEAADIALKHVNFCPTIPKECVKLVGDILLSSGLSCIVKGTPTSIRFVSNNLKITGYNWTFTSFADGAVLSTSTLSRPVITYPEAFSGKVIVKLVVSHGVNCTSTFYKIVNITTEDCNTCTEYYSKTTAEVKKLVIDLINHIYNIYKNGGSVTTPYTSPETVALSPYLSNNINNTPFALTTIEFDLEGTTFFTTINGNGFGFESYINAPLVDILGMGADRPHLVFADGTYYNTSLLYGIDLCRNAIPCPPVTGDLKLSLGESCIPISTAQSFEFTGSPTNVASYAWTFYNKSGSYPLATSQSAKPSMTYNIEGSYLVKLEITSVTGCKNSFYKTITVSANCGNDNGGGSDGSNGPNCTEVNGNALVVKQLYKTFLNSLLALNGNIPNGYTNAALTALAPYISDANPKIYNVNYTNSVLSFSFSQGETQPDIVVANYGTIVDINLVNYTTTSNPDYIITYADGTQYTKHKAKHINFCPASTDGCNLTGEMVLGTGLTCIVKGAPTSFNFITTATNVTGYNWTFYAAGDTTSILSTSTVKQPSITYTTEGDYKVKLVVSYGSNCTKTFYRLFKVNTTCNNCVETNTETPLVKKALIDLVNHIYNIYSNGGTVPHGYSCPEYVAFSKYISLDNNSSGIYVSYNNSKLEINTVEPSTTIFRNKSVMTAPLVDIQINEDFDPNLPFTYMECDGVLANGNYQYMSLFRISLCPEKTCLPLFGELKLGSGESCIAVNTPQSFHFTGSTVDIASYAWTFYNKEGTFPLLTSSFKMPYMTYNSTGDYLVKLEVTSITGCKDVFYKTITVSANCGNNNDGGGDGSNGDNCTEVNPEAKTVKHLYMTFLNSLLPLNGNIPNGFSNMELSSLALYITDINPKIYNVNYTGNILSFSFSQSDTQPDVIMATNNGAIVDINLLSYTTTGNHNYILTYKNGVQYKTHKANHINFCPNLEPCKSHVAFVFDESSSFKGKDVDRLKIRMRDFVDQQVGSNMTVSFTGLSDSDTYNRTDHIYGKITAENKAVFYTWIDNYKSGYSGRSIGVSPNSDYWASGLKQAMNGYELKPEIVILFTDGSQTADVPGLKQIVSSIINDEDSHLYVYGIDSGFYVSDTAIPLDPNNYINTDISDVTPRLKSSIKFLMGLHPDEFPASSKDDLLAGVYFGYENFDHLELDDRFFSNKLTQANIGCGGEVILKDFCYDCQTFQPSPGQTYWISAWAMEEQNVQVKTYTNAVLKIIFLNQAKAKVGEISLLPSGDIIDGWQRFASKVEIPETATIMEIELENLSPNIPVYFDDIRVHPINGSMKSFVYDPETFRLMAEQDDNNYSTFYEYDQEGGLIRIKKETSKGIKTIQESRSGSVIKQVGN